MSHYHYREAPAPHPEAPLFFVFHGTGGDENQFFELATQLLPGTRVVSLRGDVSEGGALRFFRRTGEGVYDMDDLARRTEQLIAFVRERQGEGQAVRTVGLGYSNGANILANAQFHAPALFDATVLMHPLIPITAGQRDPMAPAPVTQQLADYFSLSGAATEVVWHAGGHELRQEELLAAQRFLSPN
jgi:phospholipase/carboxylesterase